MDKTRTLPPLVRGKVTGVLNFFVDEIYIFTNNLLTDNFDLVLQVQWWGESLPVFIRPKKIQVQGRNHKNSHTLESYDYMVKYEIKTTLNLFKIYLNSCERVEFCVLETVQKDIIGSAFLGELPNLLNNSNRPIKILIFNYLGVVIGEVTIHINFIEKLQYKYEPNQKAVTLNVKNNYLPKELKKIDEEEEELISKKTKANYFTLGEKTLSYNECSKINSPKKEFLMQLKSPTNKYYLKKNKHTINADLTELVSNDDLLTKQEINMNQKSKFENKELPYKYLPEIKTAIDLSKVLYFGASSQQLNSELKVKNNPTKMINKFNSNSIKFKSKSKSISNFPCNQNLSNRKPDFKKFESFKNLSEKATKLKGKHHFDVKESLFCKSLMPEVLPYYEQSDLQSVISKESSNDKVLNYLLGSDMSKDDEEIALNKFKEMSPSHNLVSSITKLCLDSNKSAEISENGSCTKSSVISLQSSYLNYDLSNPIERNYYQKFFLKSKSNDDFEVAEFLNLPESRVKFGKLKFNETPSQKDESQTKSCKLTSECSYADKEIKDSKIKENHSVNEICISNKTSSCARCKYYKKLDELDTIIESLKHFEQKMLKHNKDLQLDFKQTSDVSLERNIS